MTTAPIWLASALVFGRKSVWMRKIRSNVFVMTPANEKDRPEQQVFRVGDAISESGIYRVHHLDHRIPHEVTLLRNEVFPRCAQCGDAMYFELVRAVPGLEEKDFRVRLYSIPSSEVEAA